MCVVLERVKEQIKSRGAKTIRGLGRTFRQFDSFDGNHKIDSEEFYSGLCEIGCRVSRDEASALMALFDTNNDGHVDFNEFLIGIRVSLNPFVSASWRARTETMEGKLTRFKLLFREP